MKKYIKPEIKHIDIQDEEYMLLSASPSETIPQGKSNYFNEGSGDSMDDLDFNSI